MNKIVISADNYSEDLINIFKYKIPLISSDIKNVMCENNNIIISVNEENVSVIKQKILDYIEGLVKIYKNYKPKIIFDNNDNTAIQYDKDIYSELKERKWIIDFENGLIGFGKYFLQLVSYYDRIFQRWALDNGAEEYIYPDFVSFDHLNKCNYISQFPSIMYFASHVTKNLDVIAKFSKQALKNNNDIDPEFLDKPKFINKSTLCLHVYRQLQDSKIDINNPIVITTIGRCKRNESANVNKIERLYDFTMREIVFIGSEKFVLGMREKFIELTKSLITVLGVQANIKSSNDPFYSSEYELKGIVQEKLKLKYEVNMFLPYCNSYISVGSLNYHNTFFSDSFNIKSDKGAVFTGCVGFGLERFVYAYLSQIGLDLEKINKLLETDYM